MIAADVSCPDVYLLHYCRHQFLSILVPAGNVTIESLNLTSNIQVVDWAPQNDVLGHPAVVAFVTQAGSHSTYEAAYHAVPMVAVPLMADQINNAVKVIDHDDYFQFHCDFLSPSPCALAAHAHVILAVWLLEVATCLKAPKLVVSLLHHALRLCWRCAALPGAGQGLHLEHA